MAAATLGDMRTSPHAAVVDVLVDRVALAAVVGSCLSSVVCTVCTPVVSTETCVAFGLTIVVTTCVLEAAGRATTEAGGVSTDGRILARETILE